MKLLPLLCLLSQWIGPGSAQGIRVVTVQEDADALLSCSDGSNKIERFDWKKDKEIPEKMKEVFFYDSASPGTKGRTGSQFKDRVLFFEDKLNSGNASIKIRRAHLDDNGTYTCILFNPYREFHIRLNVGAARKPNIKLIPVEYSLWLLLCEVEGIPKPEVEWRNSGDQPASLWAKDVQLTEHQASSGNFHVELQVHVNKNDKYTCVATQWEIHHQINNTLEVNIPDFVAVLEGGDAVLPCFINSKENIMNMAFNWKKEKKEVFFHNMGRAVVDEGFSGRMTYFESALKSGNASIKIHKTQMSDGGKYTCDFPNIQKTFVNLKIVENKSNSGHM